MTFKVDGWQTDGAFAAIEFSLAPHFPGLPPHIHHREDEIFYILQGTVQIRIGNDIFEALPGSFVLQPKGVVHTFSNPTDAIARILALNSPPGLESYFKAISEPTDEMDPPITPGPVGLQKRLALAPDYGLEIMLPR